MSIRPIQLDSPLTTRITPPLDSTLDQDSSTPSTPSTPSAKDLDTCAFLFDLANKPTEKSVSRQKAHFVRRLVLPSTKSVSQPSTKSALIFRNFDQNVIRGRVLDRTVQPTVTEKTTQELVATAIQSKEEVLVKLIVTALSGDEDIGTRSYYPEKEARKIIHEAVRGQVVSGSITVKHTPGQLIDDVMNTQFEEFFLKKTDYTKTCLENLKAGIFGSPKQLNPVLNPVNEVEEDDGSEGDEEETVAST
jgi:hypothetical protein